MKKDEEDGSFDQKTASKKTVIKKIWIEKRIKKMIVQNDKVIGETE